MRRPRVYTNRATFKLLAYGLNSPVSFHDPTGESSWPYLNGFELDGAERLKFDFNCTYAEEVRIRVAMATAILDILWCTDGECAWATPAMIQAWVSALSHGRWACPKKGDAHNTLNKMLYDQTIEPYGFIARKEHQPAGGAITIGFKPPFVLLPPQAFNPQPDLSHDCLEKFVAHEALHIANFLTPYGFWTSGAAFNNAIYRTYRPDQRSPLTKGNEHVTVWTVNKCVKCRQH